MGQYNIRNALSRFFNLPDAVAVSIVAVPLTVAFTGSLLYLANEQKKPINQQIQILKDRPTMVFTSAADCFEQNHRVSMCERSEESAKDLDFDDDSGFRYDSKVECQKNHLDTCGGFTISKPITIDGKYMGHRVAERYWHPNVVAWEAAVYNMAAAIPLYQSAEVGTAIRYDGKMFDIN